MATYITHYIIPILVIMAGLLAITKKRGQGRDFAIALFIAIGFLLGWASAYLSLYFYHLYK